MRMIPAQYATDGRRTLTKRLVGSQAIFMHRIDNPSVNRLEAVPNIRKGTRNDNRHRIVDKRLAHLPVDIGNLYDGTFLIKKIIVHLFYHSFPVPAPRRRQNQWDTFSSRAVSANKHKARQLIFPVRHTGRPAPAAYGGEFRAYLPDGYSVLG